MSGKLRPTALELALAQQAIKHHKLKEDALRAIVRLAENTPHKKASRRLPVNRLALELRIENRLWSTIRNLPKMKALIRKEHPEYEQFSWEEKEKFWATVRRSVNRTLATAS
jgi:hypothetical protein